MKIFLVKLLAPFGYLYGVITDLRNYFYDRGILKSYDLGARTISVGNVTTGGTGKTPLVALIAEILAQNEEKVCILTRGYGRTDETERVLVTNGSDLLCNDARKAGDEPLELAGILQGKNVVIVADADRVAAAKWAKEKFEVTTFILDDGFQHRRARRQLDIVCIDAMSPFGGRRALPAGRLRERLDGLTRTDIVVITRTELVDTDRLSHLKAEIRQFAPNAEMFDASTSFFGLMSVGRIAEKMKQPDHSDKLFAFCAIGNPESFFQALVRASWNIVGRKALQDHSFYSKETLDRIEEEAKTKGAAMLITTMKDAEKLKDSYSEMPIFAAKIKIEIDEAAAFTKAILATSS